MRVLRLCSVFESPGPTAEGAPRFDPVGGMQSHTGQLTRALDAQGVRQVVVTGWRPGAPRVERLGGLAVVLRLGVRLPLARQLYSLSVARLLTRLCVRADLVHVHLGEDLAVVPLGLAAARRAGIPLVLTVHCSLRHTLRRRDPTALLLRAVGGPLEGWGMRRASAVIALTVPMAERLAGEGLAGSVHAIPSGVDPARFAAPGGPDPTPWTGRPRIVFVGRLARQKDPHTLVRALARMRVRASLVLVGDGPLRGSVERLARRLRVAERVSITGFVPHREVPGHLCHGDLVAMPSRYEELGTALVEAMHAGRPVVASAVGGIPSLIEDGVSGRLVPARDPRALAEALDDLLGRPELRGRMGQAARRRVAGLVWPVLAARVLAVYREALGEAAPALPPWLSEPPGPSEQVATEDE